MTGWFVAGVLYGAAAYLLGLYTPYICGLWRSVYWHWKGGICFRYQWGPREVRNGTSSNFCRRCGQPAGSHRWGL